jgi:hypothetical protein
LGRICDTNDTATSIHRLVRITRVNLQLFSKASLRARKTGNGPELPWLNDYLGLWVRFSIFLHDLIELVNELYLNGTKPELGQDFTEYNQRAREDARNVMRRLAEPTDTVKKETAG